MRLQRGLLVGFAALLLSCGGPDKPLFGGQEVHQWPGARRCMERRPEDCPRHRQPVCGRLRNGSHRTYGNACMACAAYEVVEHRQGACSATRPATPASPAPAEPPPPETPAGTPTPPADPPS